MTPITARTSMRPGMAFRPSIPSCCTRSRRRRVASVASVNLRGRASCTRPSARGRKAMPGRMEVRAVIGVIHLRQDAAEIASSAGMARARPASRIRALVRTVLHTSAGHRGESLVVRRTPRGKKDREARQNAEEDAGHAAIIPAPSFCASRCMARARTFDVAASQPRL